MRLSLAPVALAALCLPALAGEPYQPVKLEPAQTVTAPAELITAATQFLDAVRQGNGDAIAAAIASRITTVDGGLELATARHKDVIGPFKTIEDQLAELGNSTGGVLPVAMDGSDTSSFAIKAEREFIVQSLTDGQSWGTDPLIKGATCTYAYRSFEPKAVKALADKFKTQSSNLFYVNGEQPVLKAAEAGAEAAGTLQPDLLYVLDYETDAPGHWIAVHLPEGGTGFVNFDKVQLEKPYASGICFAKAKDGTWQMVAQASTSL